MNTITLLFWGSILSVTIAEAQTSGNAQIAHYNKNWHPADITNGTHILNSQFWFRDSCFIYEFRVDFEGDVPSKEGKFEHRKGYFVTKYIFQDLRTMICQDYLNLSDTAKPISNYKLKENEFPSFQNFLAKPKSTSSYDSSLINMQLPDTMLNGKLFKRVKTSHSFPDNPFYLISYLNCSLPKNILSINQIVDPHYPGCKTMVTEVIDKKGDIENRLELNIIPGLSSEQCKIFCLWQKNANETKLPLQSKEEVFKTQFLTPKVE